MKNIFNVILFATIIIILNVNNINAQWIQTLAPLSGNITCLAASNGGIFAGTLTTVYFSSNNGSNWEQRGYGLPTSQIYSLVVDSELVNETRVYACTDIGVYLTTNSGENWTKKNNGLTNLFVHCIAVNDSDVFAGTYGNGIFYSKNNGDSWTQLKSNLPENLFVSLIAIFPNKLGNKSLIVGTNNGVFLSMDYGTSWTKINNGLDTNYVMTVIITNSDMLGNSEIFLSTKGQGIVYTSDEGSNWSQTNAGLPSNYIYSLAAVPQSKGRISLFAGVYYSGIYLSTDNGINWHQINEYLPTDNYLTLLIIKDGYIFTAINGTSIWKRPLSELITDVKDKIKYIAKSFTLEQNFPNPINPTTTINYSVPKTSIVSIKVYDVLGREVETLVNGEKSQGNYKIEFNASRLASGMYIYRMQAADISDHSKSFSETKKIILLK